MVVVNMLARVEKRQLLLQAWGMALSRYERICIELSNCSNQLQRKTLNTFSLSTAQRLNTLMFVAFNPLQIDIDMEVFSLVSKRGQLLGLAFWSPQRAHM